jgi:hypothetical protein
MGGNFLELLDTIEHHTKDSFHTYKPFFFFLEPCRMKFPLCVLNHSSMVVFGY